MRATAAGFPLYLAYPERRDAGLDDRGLSASRLFRLVHLMHFHDIAVGVVKEDL